jgi:hypothetical protein
MAKHCSQVYTTLKAFLEAHTDTPRAQRRAIRRWKQHVERNGNVPFVVKCSICSGDEAKWLIKHGRLKANRPNRAERDESRFAAVL